MKMILDALMISEKVSAMVIKDAIASYKYLTENAKKQSERMQKLRSDYEKAVEIADHTKNMADEAEKYIRELYMDVMPPLSEEVEKMTSNEIINKLTKTMNVFIEMENNRNQELDDEEEFQW